MTGDEIPDPVTKSLERILAETDVPPQEWERILAESGATSDALERILAESALPVLDLEPLPSLDLGDLPPLDLADLTDLATVTDLVDLDRLLAETSAPLSDETVAGIVSEVLGRDGV